MRVTTSATDHAVAFDLLRAVVGAGEGVVGRFPGIVCVAQCADPGPLRAFLALCATVSGPTPGRELARRLATWMSGPDTPGPLLRFGTVAAAGADELAFYLVGAVEARVDSVGGLALSGSHAAIGTDRLIGRPTAPVVLSLDDGEVRLDPSDVHDLRAGIVPGAGVVLHPGSFDITHSIAVAAVEPADREWFVSDAADVGDGDDPAAFGAGEWTAVPAQRGGHNGGHNGGRNGTGHGRTSAADGGPLGTSAGEPEVALPEDPGGFPRPAPAPSADRWRDGAPDDGLGGRSVSPEPAGGSGDGFGSRPDGDEPPVEAPAGPDLAGRAADLFSTRAPQFSPPAETTTHADAEPAGLDPPPGSAGEAAAGPVPGPLGPGPESAEGADPDLDPVQARAAEESPAAWPDWRPASDDGPSRSRLDPATDPGAVPVFDPGGPATGPGPGPATGPGPGPATGDPDGGRDVDPGDLAAADPTTGLGPDIGSEVTVPQPGPVNGSHPGRHALLAAEQAGAAEGRGPEGVEHAAAGGSAEPSDPHLEAPAMPEPRPEPLPSRTKRPTPRSADGGMSRASAAEATAALPGLLFLPAGALAAETSAETSATSSAPPAVLPPPAAPFAPATADPDALTVDVRGARIRGYRCENGHLNDPRSPACRHCGAPIDERVGGLVAGPRPPLGRLVFDDGAAHVVDGGFLVGRMPEVDDRVRTGELRPIIVEDHAGSVSRVHAEVRVSGWDVLVVDTGSRNGTYVSGPEEDTWTALPARRSRRLLPGTRVRLGARMFVFESPATVR